MDGAIELATLIVAYRWPLKELFPEADTVSDFLEGLDDLQTKVVDDLALIARLHDVPRVLRRSLGSRDVNVHSPATPTFGPSSRIG
jgi:hypothetical protein